MERGSQGTSVPGVFPTRLAKSQIAMMHGEETPQFSETPYFYGRSFAWPANVEQDRQNDGQKAFSWDISFPQSNSFVGMLEEPVPQASPVNSAGPTQEWTSNNDQCGQQEISETVQQLTDKDPQPQVNSPEKEASKLPSQESKPVVNTSVGPPSGEDDNSDGDSSAQASEQKVRPHKCGMCGAGFSKEHCLKQHLRRLHGGEKRLVCLECNASFSNTEDLTYHMEKHTAKKPYCCFECGMTFLSSHGLRQHSLRHSGVKKYKCDICGADFLLNTQLKLHIRRHNGVKPYSCSYCDKSFVDRSSQKKHMMIHTGEKPFMCCMCSAAFNRSTHLKRHMVTHSQDRPYSCTVCSHTFKSEDTLKAHQKTHTSPKSHTCSICKETFSSASSLKVHVRHTHKPKPHSCDHCDAAFATANSLKKHLVQHQKEKSFACADCEGTFFTESALMRHMLWNLGRRQFKCDQCAASFRYTATFRKHIIQHAQMNKTKYKCPHCTAAFIQSSQLRAHLKGHEDQQLPGKSSLKVKVRLYKAATRGQGRISNLSHRSLLCETPTHRGRSQGRGKVSKHGTGSHGKSSSCGYSVVSPCSESRAVRASRLRPVVYCEATDSEDETFSTGRERKQSQTGGKSYVCDLCSATFSRAGHLKRHISKHSDKR